MERWYTVCVFLCLVGLLKEFRPSEPYVTKYLVKYKNVTREEVTHVLYPIATYTHLGTLPIIFLITDFLRYKSVVIFECLSFVLCYVLLIWGDGLGSLKTLEVLYGFASSAEVGYYTIIYAKVKREKFKMVTSYVHTAIIVGNLVSAISAQTLVSTGVMNIRQLNFLTLGSCIGALVFAIFLPSVQKSMYTNSGNSDFPENSEIEEKKTDQPAACSIFNGLRGAYSNSHVFKWSVWWALAAAGNQMIRNYVQALWEAVADTADTSNYNGAVDAVHTFLSTVLSLGVGHIRMPWSKYGEPFLAFMCFIQGGCILLMSMGDSLLTAYITYIFLRVSFQVMITVASAEVALLISSDSYGLIFGINRFLALIFQSILTLVINDERGLALSERNQFMAYGMYHMGIGLIFSIASLRILFISKPSFPQPSIITS